MNIKNPDLWTDYGDLSLSAHKEITRIEHFSIRLGSSTVMNVITGIQWCFSQRTKDCHYTNSMMIIGRKTNNTNEKHSTRQSTQQIEMMGEISRKKVDYPRKPTKLGISQWKSSESQLRKGVTVLMLEKQYTSRSPRTIELIKTNV